MYNEKSGANNHVLDVTHTRHILL